MPVQRSRGGSRSKQSISANPRFSEVGFLTGRARQTARIRELSEALAARSLTLDDQAKVLGLSRSTTWTLLKGIHKGSGLTARTITRMLSAPQLSPVVRTKILEYLAEKVVGLYGDTRRS